MNFKKSPLEPIEDQVAKAFSCFESNDFTGAGRLIDVIFKRSAEFDELGLELLSRIHWLKGQLCCESRDFAGGGKALLQSLQIQEKITGRKSVEYVSLIRELAALHFSGSGNYVLARQYFEEGEAICYDLLRENSDQHLLAFEWLSDIACTLGDLFDEIDEPERASRQFLGQVVFFKKYGNKMEAYLLRPFLRLAQLAAQRRNEGEVESCLGEVFALLDASQATLLFFEALCVSADCYRKCGDLEEADLSIRAAKRISDRDSDIAESDLFVEFLRVSSLLLLEQSVRVGREEAGRSTRAELRLDAQKHFEEALKSVRSILGKHSTTEAMFHFEWAMALAGLQSTYNPEVEQAYWEALDCVDKSLNPDHPKQLRFLGPYIEYLLLHQKNMQAEAYRERRTELKNLALGASQ